MVRGKRRAQQALGMRLLHHDKCISQHTQIVSGRQPLAQASPHSGGGENIFKYITKTPSLERTSNKDNPNEGGWVGKQKSIERFVQRFAPRAWLSAGTATSLLPSFSPGGLRRDTHTQGYSNVPQVPQNNHIELP
jgi:hypothetical protein